MPGGRMDVPMTSLERWGFEPGKRVWIGGHNLAARAEAERELGEALRPPEGPIDLGFITPASVDEAVYFAAKLRARLGPTGAVWIVHPNARSAQTGEFSGSIDEVVIRLFELGYTELGAAPLGNAYTSTGFRPGGGLDAEMTAS